VGSGLRYTGNYGTGRVEHLREREAAEVEAERARVRETRARLLKLNALARARGEPARWVIPDDPDAVLPAAQGREALNVQDLRGHVAARKMKRGVCAVCGKRTALKRQFYHPACKGQPAQVIPPRRCTFCAKPLPEGSDVRRRYCDRSCSWRAYYRRHHQRP
jgi:hypothetical protein